MGGVTSSIAAKFAFFPPTPPSYTLIADHSASRLLITEVPSSREGVDVLKLTTRRGNEIVAVHVKHLKASATILYSHGNAADLAHMFPLFVELSIRLRINVMGYDFSGYGQSTGKVHSHSNFLVMSNKKYEWIKKGVKGSADEVVDCSHGKQLHEVCKDKFEPLRLNGGGHCNLEFYPEFIKHLKKFVQSVGKPNLKDDPQKPIGEAGKVIKPSESELSDAREKGAAVPEIARNSLDSQLDKSRKPDKPDKSRMSTDLVDRFRKTKGYVW